MPVSLVACCRTNSAIRETTAFSRASYSVSAACRSAASSATVPSLPVNRIARFLFYIRSGEMIALHGFIKKTQKTPRKEIVQALKRAKEVQ